VIGDDRGDDKTTSGTTTTEWIAREHHLPPPPMPAIIAAGCGRAARLIERLALRLLVVFAISGMGKRATARLPTGLPRRDGH